MAQCVVIGEAGQLLATNDSPCLSLVVVTPSEFASMVQNPFNLSPEDGFLIASAVVACWAAAFAIRAVIRVLNAADTVGVDD